MVSIVCGRTPRTLPAPWRDGTAIERDASPEWSRFRAPGSGSAVPASFQPEGRVPARPPRPPEARYFLNVPRCVLPRTGYGGRCCGVGGAFFNSAIATSIAFSS